MKITKISVSEVGKYRDHYYSVTLENGETFEGKHAFNAIYLRRFNIAVGPYPYRYEPHIDNDAYKLVLKARENKQ